MRQTEGQTDRQTDGHTDWETLYTFTRLNRGKKNLPYCQKRYYITIISLA